MSDRPPLHPIALEQLERAAKKIDADYWRVLKALQVDYHGPETLSPAKTPELLLNQLQMYAGKLFRLEEPNYPKSSSSYGLWLAALAERITARVLRTVEEVDADSIAKLNYHGLAMDKVRKTLEASLADAVNACVWTVENPTPKAPLPKPKEPLADEKMGNHSLSRQELADAYRAQFPGAKLADIAWAVHQTYREWTRWLNGEAKDGLTADKAFRRILTSGKPPSEIRPGSRLKA